MKVEDTAILATLQGFSLHWKKKYCYPNQKTLLKTLKNNWRMSICRRTLNYHLAWLEKNKYIKRYKAHYRDKLTGKFVFRSTRFYVLKYAERLTNNAIKVAETAKRFSRVQLFAQYLLTNNKNLQKSVVKTPTLPIEVHKNTTAWSEPPDKGFKEIIFKFKNELRKSRTGR